MKNFPLTNKYKNERFLGKQFNKPPLPPLPKHAKIDNETKERIIQILNGTNKPNLQSKKGKPSLSFDDAYSI